MGRVARIALETVEALLLREKAAASESESIRS